jgi:hypothetical protein
MQLYTKFLRTGRTNTELGFQVRTAVKFGLAMIEGMKHIFFVIKWVSNDVSKRIIGRRFLSFWPSAPPQHWIGETTRRRPLWHLCDEWSMD